MKSSKDYFELLKEIFHVISGKNQKWDNGFGRYFVFIARYLYILITQIIHDQCFLRAAALSFTTLLTLIPILILSFVVFKTFGGLVFIQGNLEEFLFRHLLPHSVASINQYIQSLINSFDFTTLSIVSVAFLIVSAYSLFASIESSLNAIWGIHRSRSFRSRIVNLWFLLSVSPIALGYSMYLSTRWLKTDNPDHWNFRVLVYMITIFISWIALSLLYKFVPRVSVRWHAALIGGLCGAFLWEISKFGFNYYVSSLADFTVLYQSFTIIPIFLLWVELSWIIILIGAEITYTFHHFYHLHLTAAFEHEFLNRFPFRMRRAAFKIIESLIPAFRGISPSPTFDTIAEEVRIPSDIIQVYLNVFQTNGIVMLNPNTHTYHLILDPAHLDLLEFINIVDFGRKQDLLENLTRMEALISDILEQNLSNHVLEELYPVNPES